MFFSRMEYHAKKNPDRRKFRVFCENWPGCGAHTAGTWEPPKWINADDPRQLQAAQDEVNRTRQHYCARCYQNIRDKRPLGAKEIWRLEDFVRPPTRLPGDAKVFEQRLIAAQDQVLRTERERRRKVV